MSKVTTQEFSGLRSYFWPIHAHEIKKIVPMIIMLSLVALNHNVLRNLKDALVITEKGSGAAVLPFIKLWVMLPAAIISTLIFSQLLNRFSRATVFNIVVLSFSAFFLSFALWIYPNREALHPHQSADYLQTVLPLGLKGFIAMYRNWTLTCFYVVAELWGTIVFQVLVWGFANEITKFTEAPRFYSVMVIASNTATILAGQLANAIHRIRNTSALNSWHQTLSHLLLVIVAVSILVLLTFHWMNRNVLQNEEYLPKEDEKKKPKKKKLSFRESISCIFTSKYLFCIASIVISYNLVINLVEVIWKDRLHLYCPTPESFNAYTNNLTSAIGIISALASILMAGIIQKMGWTRTALLTPGVLLLTSVAFFGCLLGGQSTLALAVFFGSVQNAFTKAAKYSVFDTTKEMAFIPLDTDEKIKGKAAIDGIGSRMAKSGGSIIHQSLLLIFGTLSASAPFISVIVIAVAALWIMSTLSLGREYRAHTSSESLETA